MIDEATDEEDFPTFESAIFAVILVGITTSLLWYAGGNYAQIGLDTILSSTTSVVLTAIVAIIYYNQWKSAEEQISIEKSLRELQSKPALEVVDHTYNTKSVDVYLANYGFGPAYDLHLEVKMECSEEKYTVDSSMLELRRVDSDEELPDLSSSAILPTPDVKLFKVQNVELDTRNGNMTFRSVFEELSLHHQNSVCNLSFDVVGKDPFDREIRETVEHNHEIKIEEIKDVSSYNIGPVLSREKN